VFMCTILSLIYLRILSTAPQSIVTQKKSMLYVAFPGFGLVYRLV